MYMYISTGKITNTEVTANNSYSTCSHWLAHNSICVYTLNKLQGKNLASNIYSIVAVNTHDI